VHASVVAKPQITTIPVKKCMAMSAAALAPWERWDGPTSETASALEPSAGHHTSGRLV
jgi:hypothetical protein